MPITTYLIQKLLNHTFRGISYTAPTNVFLALWIGDPTVSGVGGAEVSTSGTAYVREQMSFGAPAGDTIATDTIINYADATAAWGTIDYAQIMDLVALGNPLINAALTNAKTIDTDDQFRVKVGNATVQLQ